MKCLIASILLVAISMANQHVNADPVDTSVQPAIDPATGQQLVDRQAAADHDFAASRQRQRETQAETDAQWHRQQVGFQPIIDETTSQVPATDNSGVGLPPLIAMTNAPVFNTGPNLNIRGDGKLWGQGTLGGTAGTPRGFPSSASASTTTDGEPAPASFSDGNSSDNSADDRSPASLSSDLGDAMAQCGKNVGMAALNCVEPIHDCGPAILRVDDPGEWEACFSEVDGFDVTDCFDSASDAAQSCSQAAHDAVLGEDGDD